MVLLTYITYCESQIYLFPSKHVFCIIMPFTLPLVSQYEPKMPVPSSPSYWGFEDNIFESSLDFLLSQTPSHTSSLFTPAVGHQFSINPPASDHSGMAPPLRPALTEHSAEDWEQHKLIFTRLYINEKRSLKDVIKIMEDEHKFRAT